MRIKAACELLGMPRATLYRRRQPKPERAPLARPTPPNALSAPERTEVMRALHAPEHADLAAPQVWARLLDAGRYLCSISTMYRLLRGAGQSRDRRRIATHPARKKPELVATRPSEIWSWDITKLRGPRRGVWFALYVIIDIFSRYVPAWTVAAAESADVAEDLIAGAVALNGRAPKAVHADRGSPMTAKPVVQLLLDLGVARSHSRPHVSNDNPYSEAAFKTLKYCPDFPDRFGSIEDARVFCVGFFDAYNHEHRHSAFGLHTPASVHFGTAEEIRARRGVILDRAYAAHPERFAKAPVPPKLPTAAWINEPKPEVLIQTKR